MGDRECTCLGSCKGAAGLGPGWRCALERPLTAQERELLEHALGRDYPHKERDFRNYYAEAREAPTYEVWRSLEARGLARSKAQDPQLGDLVYFFVTDAGKAALDAR